MTNTKKESHFDGIDQIRINLMGGRISASDPYSSIFIL